MISTVDAFRGQVHALRLLAASLSRGRLCGALLIQGQRGLGKTTLATIVARALTCEQNQPTPGRKPRLWFCGACYACRSIAAGEQPEYVLIRPAGTDIKVEQLDERSGVLYAMSLHPLRLSYRILVLDEAHCLNRPTANQMLKLLEEPPERSLFILVTDKPELLLPTLHSRAIKVALAPEPQVVLRKLLALDLRAAPPEELAEAAALAGGSYVDGMALAQSAAWREAVKSLAHALSASHRLLETARAATEHEFAALWGKELADTGLSQAEAEKAVEKARVNELKRQALVTAYDRATLWALRSTAPPLGFGRARRRFVERINQNVDQALAQAALEIELSAL